MSDILATTNKLPAHLRGVAASHELEDWESGLPAGFPVLSTKGKNFHIVRGDDVTLITNSEDEPATGINIIVLKTHRGVAKVYYEKSYEEGDDDAPTCFSLDGIAPSPDAEDRQATKCDLCPHNQWGSRITDTGGRGKACSDQKRLAVAPAGDIDDVMLLRLAPMSLKGWDAYVRQLLRRGVRPCDVITRISFDTSVAYPLVQFKAVDFVTAEMVPQIEAASDKPEVSAIIGSMSSGAAEPSNDEADEADEAEEAEAEAAKKAKAEAAKKAKAEAAKKAKAEAAKKAKAEAEAAKKAKAEAEAAKKAKAEAEAADDIEIDTDDAGEDDLADLDFDDIDFGDDDD